LLGMARPCFGQDTHGVETFVAPQLDNESGGKPFATQYLLLDLGWKNIHSPDDHHVVGPTGDLLHSPHRACSPGHQPRKIPSAITDTGIASFVKEVTATSPYSPSGNPSPDCGSITSG